MADKMGFEEGRDFDYNQRAKTITFPIKCVIVFDEADPTKDRGGKKIKGINASGNQIDEADELSNTRCSSKPFLVEGAAMYGQPSMSIVTMNPNDGWVKELYYDRWKAGTLPPNIRVIEFDLSDGWLSRRDIEAGSGSFGVRSCEFPSLSV